MSNVTGFYRKNGKTRPITKSGSNRNRYTGQTSEPSWKKSSIDDIRKDIADEEDDEAAYRRQANKAPTKKAKRSFTGIANDEADHQKILKKITE